MSQPTSKLNDTQELAEGQFLTYVKIKVLHCKKAYLLKELFHDINSFNNEHNVELFTLHTESLQRFLEKQFGDEIGYFPFVRQVLVYSSDTNPCQYDASTLKGAGLRDRD